MCGRFVSSSPPDQIAAYFGADVAVDTLGDNYNVAPTHDVYGVVADRSGESGAPRLEAFHWGLIPSWAKDRKIASRMINARSETLDEKRSFKGLFTKQRLIIPMDGFYEWRPGSDDGPLTSKGKSMRQPMYITRVDGEPLAVAGLWTAWKDVDDADGRWLQSATVITTSANELMAQIHDRMPAVIPQSRWSDWLDPRNHDTDSLSDVFTTRNDGVLQMQDVSTDVNSVRNNDASLVAAV